MTERSEGMPGERAPASRTAMGPGGASPRGAMTGSPERPDVSVVIVSYRTRELLLAAVDSIAPALGGLRGEVIVVDNASGDGSVEALAAAHPEVHVIALDNNVGFARGVNLGAAKASSPHILLLNPDAVARPGAIEALVDVARRAPAAGLWGGRVVDLRGNPDPGTARGLPSRWSLLCFASGLSSVGKNRRFLDPESLGRWDRTTTRPVGYLTGCFLLIDRDAWKRLGGFDERYFMYSEDADLAVRARQFGFDPRFSPEATVVHHSGGSTTRPEKVVLVLQGKATFLRQHWPARSARYGVAMLQAGVALRALVARGAQRLGRRAGEHWPEVWRRRAEWRNGYPVHREAGTG